MSTDVSTDGASRSSASPAPMGDADYPVYTPTRSLRYATTTTKTSTHPRAPPKTTSTSTSTTITITSVFFFVAFIWHSSILPTFYNSVGKELAAKLSWSGSHLDAFKDPENLDPRLLREFGFAGAASHTIIFLFGLLCATMLRTLRFSSIVRSKGGRPEPIGIGVSLVLVVWTASVFHVLAQAFARYAFETRFGPVYNYATIFYKTTGESPFAWASSVSFTTALVLGFMVADPAAGTRFERLFLGPLHGAVARRGGRTLVSIVVPFCVWLGLLDRFLIPTSHAVLKDSVSSADVVHAGHAFAFAVGLVMMVAGSATAALTDTCCDAKAVVANSSASSLPDAGVEAITDASAAATASDSDSDDVGDRRRERKASRSDSIDFAKTFDPSHVLLTIQTLAGTIVLSTTLLASALFKGEVAEFGVVVSTLWRPLLLCAVLVFTAGFLSATRTNVVDVVFSLPKPLRTLVQYVLIVSLWNCHLLPFVGCWIPFHVFAYVAPRVIPFDKFDYTQLDALGDGLLYAFSGPYLAPVLIQGVLKTATTRLKVKWGLVQETFLAVMVLLPPTVVVWHRWHTNHVALPVQLFMSAMELLYLLTWRARPEYSGWRDWPELKESRIWWLLQNYFSVRFIVDGAGVDTGFDASSPPDVDECGERWTKTLPGYEPGRARIFGYHPHGLYPCTVVWQHLIPMWGSVFGQLVPYQLTDAFTHLPPGMREVQQWSGGREITRHVMSELLDAGESVIIVPGGQSELLLHTHELAAQRKIALCAKHRGFVRVALERGADLVPIVCFGETAAIENIKLFPSVQKFFRKTFGAPVPFLPVGVLGLLPFPRQLPFTLVYGRPLKAVALVPGQPTEEEVEKLYQEYFGEVRRLFYAYRETAGYGEWELVLSGFHPHQAHSR